MKSEILIQQCMLYVFVCMCSQSRQFRLNLEFKNAKTGYKIL